MKSNQSAETISLSWNKKTMQPPQFTDREKEVCDFLLRGYTNKQTALMLNISSNTVKYHALVIRQKMGVPRTWLAIVLAKQMGFLSQKVLPIICAR